MELTYVLFVISTISTFFSGYFCRKRNIAGVLTSALIAQVPTFINVTTMGVSKYTQRIVNTPTQGWMIAIVYVTFVWGIGYVLGGIGIKKKDNSDNFPGKDVKHEGFKLD